MSSHGPKGAAFARFFTVAARQTAVLLGFTIPLWTSPTEILLGVLLLCWLLSGGFAAKWKTIRHNKVVVSALAVFAVFAIGLTYTTAPLPEAVGTLLKFRKLLYVAVFVTIFADARTRDYSIRAFEIAMLITLAASFLMYWGWLRTKYGTSLDCAVFKSHITQSVFMAFLVVVLACRARSSTGRLRWLYGGIILLAVYNVFFMVQGRTGYLVILALACLLMFRWKGARAAGLAAGLVVCLVALPYNCSSRVNQRVNLAITEAVDYFYLQRDTVASSIGRRLLLYRTSIQIIRQHPLLGTGTGSFPVEFEKMPENKGKPSTSTPHSEYFNVLVQTGLLGLAVFLYWFYTKWRYSLRLHWELGTLAQALIVAYLVGSLFNSLLRSSDEGWFYCYFIALCFAKVPPEPDAGQSI